MVGLLWFVGLLCSVLWGGCCDYLVTGWFFSALFLLGCGLVVRREFVLVVAWVVGIRLVGGRCVFRELLWLCGYLFDCDCGLVLLIVLY